MCSTSDTILLGTGLNSAQGPHGKCPELESQLTSRDTSSKRPRFLGFSPPVRVSWPWPLAKFDQVTSVTPRGPLAYKIHTTTYSQIGNRKHQISYFTWKKIVVVFCLQDQPQYMSCGASMRTVDGLWGLWSKDFQVAGKAQPYFPF